MNIVVAFTLELSRGVKRPPGRGRWGGYRGGGLVALKHLSFAFLSVGWWWGASKVGLPPEVSL